MDISGKNILVTGASSGIGAELARQLAASGAKVTISGRRESALQQIADEIMAAGGQCSTVVADLTDADSRSKLVSAVTANDRAPELLINAAGINRFRLLEHTDEVTLTEMLNTNVVATAMLTQALLPAMLKQESAKIVVLGSTLGSIGYPGYSAYCASKFALHGWTESVRRELGKSNVSVLYVAPRGTLTPMNSEAVVEMNQRLGSRMDSVERVAAETLKSIRSDAIECFVGWPEKLFVRINGLSPKTVDGSITGQIDVIREAAITELAHAKS